MTVPERLPTASPRRTRAAVWALLRPRRGRAVATLLALTGSAAVSLLAAPLLGHVVDLVAEGRPADAVVGPALVLVGVGLGQGALAVAGLVWLSRLGEQVLAELRERVVGRALGLPLERVELAGTGDLSARVTEDVSVVGEAVRTALPEFARSVLLIALTLVGLAALDWRFAAAALLATPIQIATARWYLRRSTPAYRAEREAVAGQREQLLSTIGGAGTVRALGLGDAHRDRVRDRAEAVVDVSLRVVDLHARFFGQLNAGEYVGLSAILAAGLVLVRADVATVGVASAAALYFVNLFNPVNQALFLLDKVQAATASLARLVGVADLPPSPPADVVAVPARPTAPPADASLTARGLGFAYEPGHEVLVDVDLDVPAGSRVAVVGASGAGKSTLAKLLCGVHRPTHGAVRLGGVDLDALRDQVGRLVMLITQEVHVFAGPLAADLRLVRPDADDDELRDALELVRAREWVDALPDALNTIVGSGGHELTVVQAQQVALARLVLADRPVAILDEATAESGSAGARVLERAALRAVEGRTALVVAHRLTQAATADRVIVLEGGRVAERGTHHDLVAAGGRYAALWAAWSADRHRARTR